MAAGPLTCSRPATALSSQTSQRLAPRAPLPPVSQKGSGRRHGSSRWVVARWSCLLGLTLQHTELSSLLSPCAISYLPCSFLNPVGRASPAPLPLPHRMPEPQDSGRSQVALPEGGRAGTSLGRLPPGPVPFRGPRTGAVPRKPMFSRSRKGLETQPTGATRTLPLEANALSVPRKAQVRGTLQSTEESKQAHS